MTVYRIRFRDKDGNMRFAHTTDGSRVIESVDKTMMLVLADALNRIGESPDGIPGAGFKVVKQKR